MNLSRKFGLVFLSRYYSRARRLQRKHPVDSFRVNTVGVQGTTAQYSNFLVTDHLIFDGNTPMIVTDHLIFRESYGCGTGIVGGRIGGWGIGNEGGPDRVVINRSKDGLAASLTFRSTACPFLYTVKVRLSPTDLC